MRLSVASAVLVLACFHAGCAGLGRGQADPPPSPAILAAEAGVRLTLPPYRDVHTQWKERLPQPYVFFEHRGPGETFGNTMRALMEFAIKKRIESNGAPFGLLVADGVMRACLPVEGPPGRSDVGYDVLPRAMVAYAVVSGPYSEARLALPGLKEAMAGHGWDARGPVREIYLVNPASVASYDALATEIQVPWATVR